MQQDTYADALELSRTPTGPRQNEEYEESMPTLTDEIKTFIVIALAQYDTPSRVAKAVGVNFGVVIDRRQVHAYDPACLKPPAQRWRDLHATTRQALLHDTAEIGIAHKAFRLRVLDRMARETETRHYLELTAALLEQAAKECGGVYDRRPAVGSAAAQQPAAHEAADPGIDVARPMDANLQRG
jgi:hypothetical protein